jgi:hypothetical protein
LDTERAFVFPENNVSVISIFYSKKVSVEPEMSDITEFRSLRVPAEMNNKFDPPTNLQPSISIAKSLILIRNTNVYFDITVS